MTNLTESAGGDDGEPYTEDGDNMFRERVRLAVNAFSLAGPERAYEYWIKSADSNIIDVKTIVPKTAIAEALTVADHKARIYADGINVNGIKVYAHGSETAAVIGTDYRVNYSYSVLEITLLSGGALYSADSIDVVGEKDLAGNVYIYPLMEGMLLPTEAQCAAIHEYIQAADRHPMCDYIHVLPPDAVSYDISLTYYTTAAQAESCLNTVEGAGGAIDRYIQQQGQKIGQDINPDDLRRLILAPDWDDTVTSAVRVEITAPVYTPLAVNEVAHFSGNLSVTRIIK